MVGGIVRRCIARRSAGVIGWRTAGRSGVVRVIAVGRSRRGFIAASGLAIMFPSLFSVKAGGLGVNGHAVPCRCAGTGLDWMIAAFAVRIAVHRPRAMLDRLAVTHLNDHRSIAFPDPTFGGQLRPCRRVAVVGRGWMPFGWAVGRFPFTVPPAQLGVHRRV